MLCFLILSILIVGFMMNYSYFFYLSLLITIAHLFFYQIKFLILKTHKCLKIFKSNNLVGLLIFCNILIGKILMNNSEIYKRLYNDYTKNILIKY